MAKNVPDFDELDKQLGALVREWGTLEVYLGCLFSAMIGPPPARYLSLFYAIVSNQARAELMRKALLFSSFTTKQTEAATRLIAKFQTLNSQRNKYIHGSYLEEPEGVTRGDFTAPHKTDEKIFHTQSIPVNGSEILNHLKAVARLRERIETFLKQQKMTRSGQS